MPDLVPVDHDPFGPQMVPVEHDPFSEVAPGGSEASSSMLLKAVRGIGQQLLDLAKIPGQAYQSKEPITTAEMIKPATDLAMSTTLGAGAMPAEANALRTGVGVTSKGAHMNRLAQFERLEGKGASPDMNYAVSGWYRGGDEQPRYWIPDQASQLGSKIEMHEGKASVPGVVWESRKPGVGKDPGKPAGFRDTTLGDVWDHPELYEVYPWLAEIKVKPGAGGARHGMYDPETRTIYAGSGVPSDLQDTLHHEAVHAIQHREGFARGGSKEEYLPRGFDAIKSKLELAQSMIDDDIRVATGRDPMDVRALVGQSKHGKLDAEQAEVLEKARSAGILDKLKRVQALAREASEKEDVAFGKYLQLHGEF